MAMTRLLRATRQYLDLPRGNVSPSTHIGANLIGKLAVVSVEVMPCAPQLFGVGADQLDHPRRGPVDS
jgi:hypothetical protein